MKFGFAPQKLLALKLLAFSTASVLFAGNALADLEVQIGSTQRGLLEASGEVTVIITNNSSEATRIERWNTPVGGVLDDVFVVTMNGEEVGYTGVHAVNELLKPASVIITHPNEPVTEGGKLRPISRTAALRSGFCRAARTCGSETLGRLFAGNPASGADGLAGGRPCSDLEGPGDTAAYKA